MATLRLLTFACSTLLFGTVLVRSLAAEPIGWMEQFALSADRETELSELIPGTDDYFFYHCLHYQTSGDLDRGEAILAGWLREKNGNATPLITNMLDRQRLLTYSTTPQRTIDYLVRRLGINLRHAPPARKGQRRYPSQLDDKLLDADVLVKQALQYNDTLKPLGLQHLAALFRDRQVTGLTIDLRQLLERIDGPYIDGLAELVIRELTARRPTDRRFGNLPAHQQLTLADLQQVAKEVPSVADDNAMVAAVLQRLRPDADSDPSQQPQVRLEYLQRVEAYVRTLPASYNSLKASATYRLLEAYLGQGRYDLAMFMRYLQLPRVSPLINRGLVRESSQRANLSQDFMELALLPPIIDEQPLVRAHLEHFLVDRQDTAQFQPFVQPNYLNRVFAEAKLHAGIGSTERWYRLLSPAERQAIRSAVEIRLVPENRELFASDDPIELLLDIKRVDELVIRTYELNTAAYYRTHTKRIDTDINLDGLVATGERKLSYAQPDVVRHRQRIEFPELTGRGVWVIDLVGEGVRARAVVRRGSLHHVDSYVADGMAFTIIDEHRQPVSGATMLVGAREFVADDNGRLTLPPLADNNARRAIISDGQISEPIEISHLREDYLLTAGMYLDRALLQSGGQTELVIRPRLSLGTAPIDPAILMETTVTVLAKDLDNISTTRKFDQLTLSQTGELAVSFRIPARLAELQVTLAGIVERISNAQQQTLSTTRNWKIAGIRRSNQTHDAFLTRDGDAFVVEVRGRNGEIVPAATVSLALTTKYRQSPLEQTLQADDAGQIRLGNLSGVVQIQFGVAGGLQHTRDLRIDRATWPAEIHTTVDRAVLLPLPQAIESIADRYRLFSLRDGALNEDQSIQLEADRGLLKITGLEPGDYALIDRQTNRQTTIAVVAGPVIDAVATGQVRHQQVSKQRPLGIDSVRRAADGSLAVALSGDTGLARVHVYASRYLSETSPFEQLQLSPIPLFSRSVRLSRCGYVSDLRLGDEYQYVLRRRYAAKYPGVMLAQPSLLLNPWETQETTNSSQQAASGDQLRPSAAMNDVAEMLGEAEERKSDSQSSSSDYDFLADPGAQLANLRPDAEGIVTIPADVVAGLPVIQIIVCDPVTLVQRTIGAALGEAETLDLRLAKALDAEKAYTFERAVSVASQDAPLDLNALGTAQLQLYATVGELFTLYGTLVGDPRFDEFERLARWHQLDREAKLSAYTQLACHELHVFLWVHDRQFFTDVVRPYLANKKEKQFVDDWLLDADLTDYTTLWRYNELNAAEKALLAIRVPDARETVTRELRERVAKEDANHQQLREVIESALARSRLSADGSVRWQEESLGLSYHAGFDFGALGDGVNTWNAPAEPSGGMGGMMGGRSSRGREVEQLRRKLSEAEIPTDNMFFESRGLRRAEPFYRGLDSTKQWAESQWDRVRTVNQDPPSALIPVNPFWAQLATDSQDQITVSDQLLRPAENRHAALMALALCGLPLQSDQAELPTDKEQNYAPSHRVAVVTKRLRRLEASRPDAAVLIGQQFLAVSAQSPRPGSSLSEPTEFLVGEPYRGQVVISNPTAEARLVDVFWQLPAGSLPLSASRFTDSQTVELKPFAVESISYQFYFPSAGEFVDYPATVANGDQLLAQAEQREFVVVNEPSDLNAKSWEAIARDGSAAQIRDFLSTANLRDLDWILVAHRLREADVFTAVTAALGDAKLGVPELWAYGFEHRDEAAMKIYLSLRTDLVAGVGPVLHSPLLSVDPIERRLLEQLEYAPLVRARIHRLGDQDEILNPAFLVHYRNFVRTLGFGAEIDDQQQLALIYYLLLQNRIEEAIARFATVDRTDLETLLQYDYLDAYLALHRADYGRAEALARRHAEAVIPRWQERFAMLAEQLRQRSDLLGVERLVSTESSDDETTLPKDFADLAALERDRRQSEAAQEQPEVIVRVEGDRLRIDHRQAPAVTINLYGIDLELLFSKAPFVREDLKRMAVVRPMRREVVEFDNAFGVGHFDLGGDLRRQTLLVEVVAGASRSTALYYGGEITTYVSESFGQLQSSDATTNRPVSTAYVKVYAKYPDGQVRFYKDGYTDLRGRFDYASISAADAKGAERFAILVLDEERGATLHDVAAPTR